MKNTVQKEVIKLTKIVGGGQALGELADGKKCFVWGGLPGETVEVRITKKKSKMVEGTVEQVLEASPERTTPQDPESYLSTSPWQIMTFEAEQQFKSQLVDEAFTLHHVTLPNETTTMSDDIKFGYRNKVEFSWYGDTTEDGNETLDLAFFKRGSKGKVIVEGTSLAREGINILAREIRDMLKEKMIPARELKTLLIRCNQQGACVWQLYVKDSKLKDVITPKEAVQLPAQGGEIIYSDPRSPASRITKRLTSFGDVVLTDTIHDIAFRYATEGFFQVNIPVYEQALRDMQTYANNEDLAFFETSAQARESSNKGSWRGEDCSSDASSAATQEPALRESRRAEAVDKKAKAKTRRLPIVDLYAGVGSIGLTIGGENVTLVEINEDAVREMKENIKRLNSSAKAVLAPTEKALEYITGEGLVIVDPPRAGLHNDVIKRLLETKPPRIIYLSCNPVTQARDVALLLDTYKIVHHQGYNFFPRTPHIEHLVVLDRTI